MEGYAAREILDPLLLGLAELALKPREPGRQRGHDLGARVAEGERDARLFVTSAQRERLTPAQWLLLVRSHWGVENNNHHTLDTAFAEDDRPWIEADERGMLAVLVLRRIAYTLPALYRAVTLRSDEGRATRWKSLLQSVRDVLIAATEDQLAGLRQREAAATR